MMILILDTVLSVLDLEQGPEYLLLVTTTVVPRRQTPGYAFLKLHAATLHGEALIIHLHKTLRKLRRTVQ